MERNSSGDVRANQESVWISGKRNEGDYGTGEEREIEAKKEMEPQRPLTVL